MANERKYLSLDKLGLYDRKIKKYLEDADAVVLQDAKDYADGLAENYDAAGSAASAEAAAKAYADGKDAAIQAAKDAADAAQSAAEAAQGAADAAQGEVDALETYVGTFTHDTAKTVVEYINAKTDGIATSGNLEALGSRVTVVEGKVAAIEADYLVAADKEELAGDIDEVAAAVATEQSRAEGAEAELSGRIDAIVADYLVEADKTELQGNIDTLTGVVETLRDGIDAEKVDGVKDLITYVEEHGAEVTGMQEGIAANAEAIEALDGRMTTAEGKIEVVEGAVATKAEQSALEAAVDGLEAVDAGIIERLALVEAELAGEGEGTVADQIEAAKQAAIAAAAADAATKDEAVLSAAKAYADDEDAKIEARVTDLEAASATHALASDLTALTTRVETAEGEIDTIQSDIEAVEALVAANTAAHEANAAAIALKASQADLDAAVKRIADNEAAIASFVEISEEDINGLF